MPALPQRVGLNAMFLDPGVSGGAETYLRGLAPALARLRPELELEIATTRRGAAALREEGWGEWAAVTELPADEGQRARRLAAEQVLVPRLARRRGWHLVHSLATTAPLYPRVPAVITVLDLLFLRLATLPRTTTVAMGFIVRRASRRAARLIAISEAERDQVRTQLGLPGEAVVAIPLGPGRAPAEATPADEVRARFRLAGSRVALCLAAKRRHKNQALLVRAAALLPADWVIVLAGHPEAYDAELRALAAELGVEERVRFVGYVSDSDAEGLAAVASCAAIPTLAEGFGLPVLEAMRRGLPVACSNIPVLREVAGDAARYFDPHDPDAAAAAILAAADAPELVQAGRRRAQEYSWERTARETLAVYDRALGG
jgi:glycosyltransferase involved in cell wall biosynthesis